jgi:hypothetical protein
LTERLWLPLVWHSFHLFTAVELMPTVLATLVKPFGRSPVRILPVIAKGHAAQVTAGRFDLTTCTVLCC